MVAKELLTRGCGSRVTKVFLPPSVIICLAHTTWLVQDGEVCSRKRKFSVFHPFSHISRKIIALVLLSRGNYHRYRKSPIDEQSLSFPHGEPSGTDARAYKASDAVLRGERKSSALALTINLTNFPINSTATNEDSDSR